MTVAHLIEELQMQPQHLHVYIAGASRWSNARSDFADRAIIGIEIEKDYKDSVNYVGLIIGDAKQ